MGVKTSQVLTSEAITAGGLKMAVRQPGSPGEVRAWGVLAGCRRGCLGVPGRCPGGGRGLLPDPWAELNISGCLAIAEGHQVKLSINRCLVLGEDDAAGLSTCGCLALVLQRRGFWVLFSGKADINKMMKCS